MNEEKIFLAEIALLDFFKQCKEVNAWYPVRDIHEVLKASGVYRNEAKEARKRLGIESLRFDNGQCWKWSSEDAPDEILRKMLEKGTYL